MIAGIQSNIEVVCSLNLQDILTIFKKLFHSLFNQSILDLKAIKKPKEIIMVLGWGKKTVTKQDEDDMTMDEILASIRRYVTEDQNTTREPHAPKQPPFIQGGEPQFETARSPQQEPTPASMTDYNEPYGNEEILRELSQSIADTPSPARMAYEDEMGFKPESMTTSSKPEATPSHYNHIESGITSEGAISAAAIALSKLEEVKIKSEQQALEAMGALTLDTLIANLARPMIKEWLDQNLPQIVEAMVEREIERIRNYSLK